MLTRIKRQSSSVPPSFHEVLRAPGRPLDVWTRSFFEPRLGHDFGRVRVHSDSRAGESARALNAAAYTIGRDIVFAPGRYTPETRSGTELLAHELTHVVQQSGSAETTAPGLAPVEQELEAERASQALTGSAPFRPSLLGPQRLARRVPIPEDLDPEERRRAEEYLAEAEERRRHPPPPAVAGQATFKGTAITVSKDGQTQSCAAFTSSSAPTPTGRFCVRRQGEAQRWGGFWGTLGRFGGSFAETAVRQDRSRWYLLEPQFSTSRSKMQLHYGVRSEGCITVGDAKCFQRLENVLNAYGTSPGTGYDGYPPGNAEGVSNPQRSVDCVAMLDVT